MAPGIAVGLGGLALGGALCVAGWIGVSRFGAALRHRGIGRAAPLWHSAVGLAGYAAIIAGVVSLFVSLMLLFV